MSLFINNKEQCLSLLQQLQIDSFDLIKEDMFSLVKKANNSERLGKNKIATKYWDINNDLLYLNTYLMIVKNRIFSDVSHGIYKTYNEYDKLFALDCIIKTFDCHGINIRPLYALYGLLLDTFYTDGIEYIILQPNLNDNPDFIIS